VVLDLHQKLCNLEENSNQAQALPSENTSLRVELDVHLHVPEGASDW